MTSTIDPLTGKKIVQYRCLGLTNVIDATGANTCNQLKRNFQLGAILSAKSADAEDILQSLKEIISKVRYSVTDTAGNMKTAVELFAEWRKDMTGLDNLIWLHCNAHVLPALDNATEKALMAIEGMLGLKLYACQKFNKVFFKSCQSVITIMLYAIFSNVAPSAKSQDWSCTIVFHNYLTSLGEKINRFFDPQSSRFGKETEMGMIVAYNFKILQDFFQITYMPNNMFRACELYMNCPMLYEITIALTLMYYHILGPFKVACGAENQFGLNSLSHKQLLDFYKLLVTVLEELATDPTPMIGISVLPKLSLFNLSRFSKSHLTIFNFVFEEIQTNKGINTDIIKSILKIICEEYLIAINRQVNEFYLKNDSIVERIICNDDCALDNVPTTSLAAERSVALARSTFKLYPSATTRTHSNFQMINSAPFFHRDFMSMNAYQLMKLKKQTKMNKLVEIANKFHTQNIQLEKEAREGTVKRLIQRRDKNAIDRSKICQAVKKHGGPLCSPDQVDDFCKTFGGNKEQLMSIIDDEIKFQKLIINSKNHKKSLYQKQSKDKVTGKMNKF